MMARSSPRRNQRSKGFKVKHAIQLCLVVGVGVWLVYQVRHYYDKKAEYQDSVKTGDDVLMLVGRKGLPQVEEVIGRDVEIKEEEERSNNVENVDGGEVVHDHFHDKTEAGAERRGDSIDGDKETDESKENVNGDQAAEENGDVQKESKEKVMGNGDQNKEIEEGKETESRDKSNEEPRENTMEQKSSAEAVAGGVIKKVVEEDNGMETKETESNEDKFENSGHSDENLNGGHGKEAREEHYKGDDTSSAVEHESGNFDAASGDVHGYRDKTGKSEQIESKENAKTEVAEVDPNELPSAIEHEPAEKSTNTSVTSEKGVSENGKKESDEGSHGTRTEETESNEQQQVDSKFNAISSGNSDSSPKETYYVTQNQNETMEKIQLKGEDSSVNNVVLMETEKSDDASNQQSDSNVWPSNAANNLDSVNQELKGSSNSESFASDSETANHNEDAVNEDKSSGHSGDTNQESISLLNTNDDTDAGKKEDVDSSNSQEDTLSSKSGNEDAGKEERANSTKSLEKGASSNENHNGDAAQNQNESADHNNMDITNQTQQVDGGHNEIKHTAVASNTSNKPDSSEEHVNLSESSTSQEDKESSSDTNTNNDDSQNGSGNSSQNGSVDSSNSSVSHEEKEAPGTLPKTQNQRDDAAAAA